MGYMLDTSLFNKLLDGVFPIDRLPRDASYCITHIQRDELNATPEKPRRFELIALLENMKPASVMTESGVAGLSIVGEFRTSEAITYEAVLAEMNRLKPKKNHRSDALIAETALLSGHILISADRTLCTAMEHLGGKVIQIPNHA